MVNQRIRLVILCVTFALSALGVQQASHFHAQQQRKMPNWDAVSRDIGGWKGSDGYFDPIYGDDPAESSLLRVYQKGNEPPVVAYVGFYRDLTTVLEVHTPELCYPAQGWTILSTKTLSPSSFRGKPFVAKEIVVDKSGQRRLVMWWYNVASRPFENRIRYVYAMLAISILTGRTDGSIIRIETPIKEAGDQAAGARMRDFQDAFLPELDRALPQ